MTNSPPVSGAGFGATADAGGDHPLRPLWDPRPDAPLPLLFAFTDDHKEIGVEKISDDDNCEAFLKGSRQRVSLRDLRLPARIEASGVASTGTERLLETLEEARYFDAMVLMDGTTWAHSLMAATCTVA
ncbi:hypothetical protein AB0D89_33325 [Streptomyces luteogriseus]|uniref:hypothetical protein n=1 Tax=Streptomyces luteogriseus TaxID=68233 RepID=UPI0033EF8BBF